MTDAFAQLARRTPQPVQNVHAAFAFQAVPHLPFTTRDSRGLSPDLEATID